MGKPGRTMQGSDIARLNDNDVAATVGAPGADALTAQAYPTDESHWGHVGQSPARTAWALPDLAATPAARLADLNAALGSAFGAEADCGSALWRVDKAEYEEVFAAGRDNPAFGESNLHTVVALLLHEGLTANDTFIDVGSGLGKVTMAASLFPPARRCAGVELSPHRAAAGTAALPKLRELLAENGDAIAGADDAAAADASADHGAALSRVQLFAGQILSPEHAELLATSTHIYFSIRSSPPRLLMLVVERLLELARDFPDRAPVVVWAVNTPLGKAQLGQLRALGGVRLTAVFEGKTGMTLPPSHPVIANKKNPGQRLRDGQQIWRYVVGGGR